MLSLSTHRQVAALTRELSVLVQRVKADAPTEEIEFRTREARETLDALAETIGARLDGPLADLARHLHWIAYHHRRGNVTGYADDLQSLLEHDLPGVVERVSEWSRSFLDPGLVAAVSASWDSRQYDGAVREAFIHLEHALRSYGNVDPARGLSGEKLVTEVLGPNRASPTALVAGPFGDVTRGEASGAYHLIRGAFLLVRNATAHRAIAYTLAEAEDVLHLVNLCLRLLRAPTPTTARAAATS